MEVEG